MEWETPAYTEINMSSEVGGYQDDFEDRTPGPGNVPPAVTDTGLSDQPQS